MDCHAWKLPPKPMLAAFPQMEAAERAVFFEDWPKDVVAEVEELQRREAGDEGAAVGSGTVLG